MQSQILKEDGLSREIEVTVTADEIDERVENRLRNVIQNLQLPGFRKGKVPLKIAKRKYGRSVMGEVLETAVNETSSKVLSEKGLKPAMQPKIEVKNFDEGKDLTYTMAFDLVPDFELKDIKGIKLEKQVAEPDDKAVEEALERIASNQLATQPIESDRASKKGDILLIDFHGRTADDNVEHPGMHAHDHKLKLGGGQFIPGFEDQLVGKKAGDKVEVKITFPEEYGAPELAGRDAVFDVEIKEIHEETETSLDEEFAKSLGMDSLQALKDNVKEQLQKEYDQHARMKLKKQLLDYLDQVHDLEAPPGMLDLEYQSIEKQMQTEQKQAGNTEELSEEDKQELKDIAARRVRLGLILSEIGAKNDITVSQAELQRAVVTEAQRFPGQEKQVFDFYSKNEQALESLRAPVFEDKVVDFILELADTKENKVSVDELTADEGAEEEKPKAKQSAAKKSSAKKPDTANKKGKSGKKSAAGAKPAEKKSGAKAQGAKKTAKKKVS